MERAFARLAQKAEARLEPLPGAPQETVDRPIGACGAEECPERPYSMSVGAILRYLGWGYLMLHSREHHLANHVGRSRAHGEHPQIILNHLVDYDEWLADRRLPGSSHDDQVEVTDALARAWASLRSGRPSVDLRTFAGFCPLRHALEIRRLGRPVSFEIQLAKVDEGKIAGFKLYPPMGFRPSGNSELRNRDFNPRSHYRAAHFARWSAEFGSSPDGTEIGAAIDASLEVFFSACEARDIPLMAHASPGNDAGPAFGQRANPRHWLAVASRFKLRLCLGHIVGSAEDFVCAVRSGRTPECVWALGASRSLLDPRGSLRATVFGDLSFMPELVESPALAADFFRCLRHVYGAPDPGLTRIIYGSDYIMLGSRPGYDPHLSAMRNAMSAASYDRELIDNILQANARRFLTTRF